MKSVDKAAGPVLIPESPQWLEGFAAGVQENQSKPLPYRIFAPPAVEGKLPLVVYFHGIRGRGDDNFLQMQAGNRFGPAYFSSEDVQSRFPCLVLAPQCSKDKYWVNFTRGKSSKQLRKAIKLIEEVKEKFQVDEDRVYVVGQSMGGFATWAALVEYPEVFAAAVAVSGGGNPRRARYKLAAPIWIFHGALDPLVGVWRSRQMVETLERASKPHTYTEIPEGKHDIWPIVFGNLSLAKWMFSHKRAPKAKK